MASGVRAFDVVVEGSDAAAFVAALACARIGLRVANVVTDATPIFEPENFSNHGGIIAELCDQLGVGYSITDVPSDELAIVGIPANPFSRSVRTALGWSGAWRVYADRLLPLLSIGNEEDFGRLVTKRLGRRASSALVGPALIREFGVSSMNLPIVEVAPGLSQAMSRVGSLTSGVLELIASDSGWAQRITIDGGTQALMQTLRDRMDYFAVQVLSQKEATKVTATVRLDDVAASEASPSWERAIVRAQERAEAARIEVLRDPSKPPVGPIDLAR